MKINFKRGLKRIGIILLILMNLFVLLKFFFSGFIFWDIDYISKAKVLNLSNNTEIDLIDFSQKHFEKEKELYQYTQYYFDHLGFRVHPYKRYFKNYDNITFKDNEHIKINNEEYIVKLPSAFSYFIS